MNYRDYFPKRGPRGSRKAPPRLPNGPKKIQKLPNPVEGVPNWRCVPGYQVYVCGQPTKAGFEAALEKVTASYPKDGPIVWVNMRQEPNVYVNGQPMCARPPNKEPA